MELFLAKESVVSNSSGEMKTPKGKQEITVSVFYKVALVSSSVSAGPPCVSLPAVSYLRKNRMVK